MCKSKTVAGIERGMIWQLYMKNLSQRVITSEICRSTTEKANFLKDPDEYGTKKHTGRPEKISPQSEQKYV